MRTKSSRPVPVASRVNRFSYAIRNIVAEAKAVEAAGKHVRYLNIGDPVAFGFQTPPHVIDAATRAMRCRSSWMTGLCPTSMNAPRWLRSQSTFQLVCQIGVRANPQMQRRGAPVVGSTFPSRLAGRRDRARRVARGYPRPEC